MEGNVDWELFMEYQRGEHDSTIEQRLAREVDDFIDQWCAHIEAEAGVWEIESTAVDYISNLVEQNAIEESQALTVWEEWVRRNEQV